MHVDLYERVWMWAASGIVALFLVTIVMSGWVQAIQPPSHMETLDPTRIGEYPEWADPKVTLSPEGAVRVSVRVEMFSFTPDPIEVPAKRPVTFRVTSGDVLHGFHVVGTNANAMAIPGYVSQFTVTFPRAGEYLVVCNEYCGLAHHDMVGKLIVKEDTP